MTPAELIVAWETKAEILRLREVNGELLTALKAATDEVGRQDPDYFTAFSIEVNEQMRAAIAKAERQP
jgi:hypothetical protein